MTAPFTLPTDEMNRIKDALREAFPAETKVGVVEDKVLKRGEDLVVPVVPLEYPEDKWAFFEGLAKAEIALRDAHDKVRLEPHYAQRMLLVVRPPQAAPFAYKTTEGNEREDWPRASRYGDGMLDLVATEAFLWDTDADFEAALIAAKAEYGDLDFYPREPDPESPTR